MRLFALVAIVLIALVVWNGPHVSSVAVAAGGSTLNRPEDPVVLTGSGMDGADGARAVKAAGGRVLVQDPELSEHGGMPRAAIATGAADSVVSLPEIAPAIVAHVAEMNPN